MTKQKQEVVRKITELAKELSDTREGYGAASVLYYLASAMILNRDNDLIKLVGDFSRRTLKDIDDNLTKMN